MAGRERPATPPARSSDSNMVASHPPITPEQVRRMEENRLRAKARRQQEEAAAAAAADARKNRMTRAQAAAAAGTKRNFSSISSERVPSTSRDARNAPPAGSSASQAPDSVNVLASTADTSIRPARKFQKYVEYDFSKMTDTKGGFMTQEDDPFNKVLHAPEETGKPANMTLKEWEQLQLQKRLRDHRQGPYEPGLSILDRRNAKKCRECGSMEIDWQWDELLGCQVCQGCKDKFPEKYSLLTKTEAKEDYLLTDPELRDEKLLPHLIKPNPHKSSWNNMMLYLRFQIEEYAFSARKWGSAEALDEEFARRTQEAKDRKEKKFQNKLNELKKRTRVEAYKRARGGGGGEFGDMIGTGRHEHEWGRPVEDPETGMTKKACVECGMEVEELEF